MNAYPFFSQIDVMKKRNICADKIMRKICHLMKISIRITGSYWFPYSTRQKNIKKLKLLPMVLPVLGHQKKKNKHEKKR